jgi:uncharacterized protein (DUF1330 family)
LALETAENDMYIDVTPESGHRFFASDVQGELVMLNLLRLREWADYRKHPSLAPSSPVSGMDALNRYISHSLPLLRAAGGELLFVGKGSHFLIGPFDERWDIAMLVKQKSKESLLTMASDPEYLAGIGHRTAAVEDSRLLPLTMLIAPKSQ